MEEKNHKDRNERRWPMYLVVVLIIIIITFAAFYFGKNSNNNQQQMDNVSTTTSTQSSVVQPVQTETPTPTQASSQSIASAPQSTHNPYTPMTFSTTVEALRSSVVNKCISGSATWGECNCTFDYLIINYGYQWLTNEYSYFIMNGVNSPEFSSAVLNAAKYCSIFTN